jgi:hypothetical protein
MRAATNTADKFTISDSPHNGEERGVASAHELEGGNVIQHGKIIGRSWTHGTAVVNDPLLNGAARDRLRYDADWTRKLSASKAVWANIPPKRNRKTLSASALDRAT